jgi:translation initiation factor IF-2
MRTYRVIYEMIDQVRMAMEGLLAPEEKEIALGQAEVRDTFKVSKVGTVAGCHIILGKILRNANARLIRDQVVVFEGKFSSLKRFKDDVKEVAEGYECGIGLDGFNDIKVGDVIEAYEIEKTAVKLQ